MFTASMAKRFGQTLFVLISWWMAAAFQPSTAAGEVGQYIYIEKTGDQQVHFSYALSRDRDRVLISSRENGKSYDTICSREGSTWHWVYTGDDGEKVTGWRQGDVLRLFGRIRGGIMEKEVRLGGRPWYQALSFSLRSLVLGEEKEKTFWLVRPDTMDVVSLIAKRKECRQADEADDRIESCLVEVRKEGVSAMFWRAEYWFRKSDGIFIRYRSVHGPPGTPPTSVQLLREPARSEGYR